jgi:hypothetical protein
VASPASATYEQIDNFAGTPGVLQFEKGTPDERSARWPEEVQLGGIGGMAVNVSGAGGVPPGTVYTAGYAGPGGARVARFNPDGEFREAWTFTETPGFKERCGPEGDPAHPVCSSRPGSGAASMDVEVDQANGNVYVFNAASGVSGGQNLIHVYSSDGSELISEFGEYRATSGETTAEGPEKIHGTSGVGNIGVDAAGNVYVMDFNAPNNFYHRLMVFKPQSPGDYEHYVYAGQSHDLWAGFAQETQYPMNPVTDAAGDVYVSGDGYIAKLDPSQPSAPALCEFSYSKRGIESMTVDSDSGEVFFFTSKDKKVHQLSPCNAEGEFAETGSFAINPKRNSVEAMAFNPSRQFDLSRSAGVLYGGTSSGEGGKTEGTSPDNLTESAIGYIFAPPKELLPKVEAESVEHVTSSTTELGAKVNPKGSQTRYVFQYLTDAAFQENGESFIGATEAPPGGAVAGEGQAGIDVSAALSGLAADTEYRYRAIATSHCSPEDSGKVCEDIGATQSFHTFPAEAAGLTDGRAYELVSPLEKLGGQVLPADPTLSSCTLAECKPGSGYQHFPMQSTPDGEAIVYEGTPFSPEGAVIENEYLARRDEKTGWQTTNLTPPLLISKEGQGYRAFDTELTEGLFEQTSPSLSPEAPSEYTNLYLQPTRFPTDLSPLLRAEPPNRLPGTGNGHFRLTYAGASADFSRFFFEANDALSEETPFAPEPDGSTEKTNLYEWAEGQLSLVNVLPGNAEAIPGAVFGSGKQLSGGGNIQSDDFSYAISDDGSRVFWSSEAGQVYVRDNGEATRKIEDPGKFLTASADGSKLLLNDGCLYDLAEEECEDLTAGKGGFQGIAGQSEDLSHVYFVDTAVLDEAANDQGALAQAGQNNLYSWHEGDTTFVAMLRAADNPLGDGTGDWNASPARRTAEASPDGRWVAFLTKAPLTKYDNVGPCEHTGGGETLVVPCPEAVLYDSATERLICASCNPGNQRPQGGTALRVIAGAAGSLPQPRYLTNSGRLYFDSHDSLTPADTNDRVEDVYQYEPNGIGSCKRQAGCVSLISAGSGVADSNFLAIDETAKSVFFTTRDQLVLKDHDELIDLYVAREGGGIPAESEVARSECQGEACQAQAFAPSDPTPASSSVDGAGNVDEQKTTKKHRKKRKHAKKHKSNPVHKRAAKHNRGGAK